MRPGWARSKLADVIIDIKDGGTPSRKNPRNFGGDIFWCVVKDIKPLILDTAEKLTREGLENCSAKVWPVGSLIISLGATIGQIGIAKVPTATKQGLAGIVVDKQKLVTEFLAYALRAQVDYIRSLATGTTIKEIRPVRFAHSIWVPVPVLSEQNRIVGLLDEAFAGIAVAKANAERNLLNAHALFQSRLQSAFVQGGVGWVKKTLGEVCEQITDGKHGDCTNEYNSEFFFLSAKDVKNGTLHYEKARQISRSDFEETHRRTNLEPGDILITNAGTIGRMAIAPENYKTRRTTFQKSVAILKPKKTIFDSEFAFYCLSSGLARFKKLSAGAAQKNLLLRDLRSYVFSTPAGLDEQRIVAAGLRAISIESQRLASLYERKLVLLEALKNSLLHRAFSGEL